MGSEMCIRDSLPSGFTASQFYGLWYFETANGRHKVMCEPGEEATIGSGTYPTLRFNVFDTLRPEEVIAESSWNLLLNGTKLQLGPERRLWCMEIYSTPCPIDVEYTNDFVAGRYWKSGDVGVGSFSFLFDYTRI